MSNLSNICPNCGTENKGNQPAVASAKFNAIFCNHDCYVVYRKTLDATWEDKPIFTSEPVEK